MHSVKGLTLCKNYDKNMMLDSLDVYSGGKTEKCKNLNLFQIWQRGAKTLKCQFVDQMCQGSQHFTGKLTKDWLIRSNLEMY